MPLKLAVFYPSIEDLRQFANDSGELELRIYNILSYPYLF